MNKYFYLFLNKYKRIFLKVTYTIFFTWFLLNYMKADAKATQNYQNEDRNFQNWLKLFKLKASSLGISKQVLDDVFSQKIVFDHSIFHIANHQPEFITKPENYFKNRITKKNILIGRQKKKELSQWLSKIEDKFGVDSSVLLSIWSMETGYGSALQKPHATYDIVNALSNLAFLDPKRKIYAETQLIAALKILQAGHVKRNQLKGSWAGAMGHTQFIPTSYLYYGTDIENRGWPDIWNSIPDALSSAANLLKKNGWIHNQNCGYEVRLPPMFDLRKFRYETFALEKWQELNVTRADKKKFNDLSIKASLLFPDTDKGPIFLVMKNFYVIKNYNNSDLYALGVCLLANQISGDDPF